MTNRLPGIAGSALTQVRQHLSVQAQRGAAAPAPDAADPPEAKTSARSKSTGGPLDGLPGPATDAAAIGRTPQPDDVKPAFKKSLSQKVVDYTQGLVFGAPSCVTEPAARAYMEFVHGREVDYADARFSSWTTKGLTPTALEERDRFIHQVGVDERFRQFLPAHLDAIYKSWTGSGAGANTFTEGPPPFDYLGLCNALAPEQLAKTAARTVQRGDGALIPHAVPLTFASRDEKAQFTARAALSAQLGNVLAMLSQAPDGPTAPTFYRTLGYMNPDDPRARKQLQALAAGQPIRQSVLTSISESRSFGEADRGVGALQIRMAPGLRAPALSGSQVFAGERERNLSCVRFEPRGRIATNVFEVEAVLDVQAVTACIAQCVTHGVLSSQQAQDLQTLLRREPAVLHAVGPADPSPRA